MAQLNPTVGELNKFAINGAGVSDNALVFGKDQNPVDSTYGFDSSTDQTGVTVFFSSKNIAPGKSTQLEVWLWNGSAWSKWTTIDGNDANFDELDSTSVNFKWTMGGTTYSKMYFNAKNLDTGMKLRVTGQEGQLVIDEDLTDGAYDQKHDFGGEGSVTAGGAQLGNASESLSTETSNRTEVISKLNVELSNLETVNFSSELSLETEIANNSTDLVTLSSSIATANANILVELSGAVSNNISAITSTDASTRTHLDALITLANAEDQKVKNKWLNTHISKVEASLANERADIRDFREDLSASVSVGLPNSMVELEFSAGQTLPSLVQSIDTELSGYVSIAANTNDLYLEDADLLLNQINTDLINWQNNNS